MSVQTQINRINGAVSDQTDLISQLKGAINENVSKTSSEVSEQASLIAEIKTALEGKASVQLPELTNPGKASDMLSGKQLIDQNGAVVTGTIATKTASNLSASGATVTVPAGYYASQATKNVATATQATPSISVSSGGLITASATQSAGYVASGTKSATKQLTTQAAQTITPSTSDKTIASGRYLTGVQTIKGDANLKAENIAEGVSIFGITGTHSGGSSGGANVVPITFINISGYGFDADGNGVICIPGGTYNLLDGIVHLPSVPTSISGSYVEATYRFYKFSTPATIYGSFGGSGGN